MVKNFLIRSFDDEIKKGLQEIAEKEKTSVSEVCRNVLKDYVTSKKNDEIENKFINFTEDIINLYQMDREEMILLMERMESIMQVQEELLSEIQNVLNIVRR